MSPLLEEVAQLGILNLAEAPTKRLAIIQASKGEGRGKGRGGASQHGPVHLAVQVLLCYMFKPVCIMAASVCALLSVREAQACVFASAAYLRLVALCLQVLVCKLIDLLDPGVPWDEGPPYDEGEAQPLVHRDDRWGGKDTRAAGR